MRLALLDEHRVPGAGAAARRRRTLLIRGVTGGALRLAARVAYKPRMGGGDASPREGLPLGVGDARLDGPLRRGPDLSGLLGDVGLADGEPAAYA